MIFCWPANGLTISAPEDWRRLVQGRAYLRSGSNRLGNGSWFAALAGVSPSQTGQSLNPQMTGNAS